MAFKSYNKLLEDEILTSLNLLFPSLMRLTYDSRKQVYDRLMLKKISRKIIFKVLTAISCPLKALDRFTQCSLRNLLHFLSINICQRTPQI